MASAPSLTSGGAQTGPPPAGGNGTSFEDGQAGVGRDLPRAPPGARAGAPRNRHLWRVAPGPAPAPGALPARPRHGPPSRLRPPSPPSPPPAVIDDGGAIPPWLHWAIPVIVVSLPGNGSRNLPDSPSPEAAGEAADAAPPQRWRRKRRRRRSCSTTRTETPIEHEEGEPGKWEIQEAPEESGAVQAEQAAQRQATFVPEAPRVGL